MRSISLSVSEDYYEAFRAYASQKNRSIAELVREAMRLYRDQFKDSSTLDRITVVSGLEPLGTLPRRSDMYDEVGERHF